MAGGPLPGGQGSQDERRPRENDEAGGRRKEKRQAGGPLPGGHESQEEDEEVEEERGRQARRRQIARSSKKTACIGTSMASCSRSRRALAF